MDAVKFLIEVGRMCRQYPDCHECQLYLKKCHIGGRKTDEECREMVAIVEKWREEHPVVTNGMKVRDLIPGSVRSTNCYPAKENALPGQIVGSAYMELIVSKSWWDAEYKEGEK